VPWDDVAVPGEGAVDVFGRSVHRLAQRLALLLPADPGFTLLDQARPYDPGVRRWRDRLIFRNGVQLFGPVTVPPDLAGRAGLSAGRPVACYADSALQPSRARRRHEATIGDAELLLRALADRLGGATHPSPLRPGG
jgi:hypothetical protein